MSFPNKPDSWRDLTLFMISFISSFKSFNVIVHEAKSEERPYSKIFWWIAAVVADAAAVNPNCQSAFSLRSKWVS